MVDRFLLAVAPLLLLPVLVACGKPARDAGEAARVDTVPSADGVPVVYEVRGEGAPTLVFVHGWSCDRGYWYAQVEPFSRESRIVTVDLAGHGDSGPGREDWSMASFGADVAAVVRQLEAERVVLVGHSMGGDVIVEAARRLPGRVAGLVWVDTYNELGDPRTPEEVRELMAPFREDFVTATRSFVRGMFPPGADDSLVEEVAADMSSAPPDVALGALEAAVTFDREIPPALEELAVPVVAINPEEPPTDVASLERHGVEVVTLSGVGHFLMMEDPESFNHRLARVIDGFVR
ncbi:MAG: alpha/beta fold hydrolase [Gemmatimonadota bacterium]